MIGTTPLVNPPKASAHLVIACVLDASSSMQSKVGEVISGFNNFIEEQKKLEGDPPLYLTFFNTEARVAVDGAPLSSFNVLDTTNYRPEGYTALLDAVGDTIHRIERAHPGSKVAMCIVTDGEENASRRTTRDQLRQLIEKKQGDGWVFIYLGAHANAFADAKSFGIRVETISTYDDTKAGGTRAAYMQTNSAVANLRNTGAVGNWKDTPDQSATKGT